MSAVFYCLSLFLKECISLLKASCSSTVRSPMVMFLAHCNFILFNVFCFEIWIGVNQSSAHMIYSQYRLYIPAMTAVEADRIQIQLSSAISMLLAFRWPLHAMSLISFHILYTIFAFVFTFCSLTSEMLLLSAVWIFTSPSSPASVRSHSHTSGYFFVHQLGFELVHKKNIHCISRFSLWPLVAGIMSWVPISHGSGQDTQGELHQQRSRSPFPDPACRTYLR